MADESKPLDSGFLYSPRFWPRDKAWEPKPGECRASVSTPGMSMHWNQCSRKAKVARTVNNGGRIEEVEYCGIHDPVAVKAKREAREAKWKADWAAKNAKWAEEARLKRLNAAALDAIKHIAKGHNDPRTLALEVLAKHGESL